MPGEGSASTIANAQELDAKNAAAVDAWAHVKEAPAPGEPAAPAAAPAAPAEPTAPAAPAPTGSAPAAPAQGAPPAAPAPGASAAAVQEFIDALIGEGDKPEVLKIPGTARIPLEVGGQVEYVTAAELRKRGMLEADYTRSKQQLGEERRELEGHAARLIADRARLGAREKYIADERKRLQEAQKSPEAWERYQNHLRMLAEDPEYARVFDDALMGRERAAEDEATAAADHRELVGEGIAQAATWMLELANEPAYADVDLDRVRETYAAQLEGGRAALDRGHVERIFKAEADQVKRTVGPLQQQIAELRAQVNALQGKADAAGVHNRTTQHAIERAAAVPVATGQPAAPAPADRKVAPFTPRQLPDVNREWAARRD